MLQQSDLIIIGGGAAGMTAAIFAGEARAQLGRAVRIVVLEGATKPGAKILVSGGGRCNVTNREVSPEDFAGGPKPLIRKVLRAFDERRTLAWMEEIGVQLKLEPTGKYFPVSDKARTVLDALLRRMHELGVEYRTGMRVQSFSKPGEQFQIHCRDGSSWEAHRVILATGGLSLPKSGSDGAGLQWARELGHTVVATTPALVPLLLNENGISLISSADLAGLTLPLRLLLQEPNGRVVVSVVGSTLFTHFGISGPGPLDISRHYLRYRLEHPQVEARLAIGHPDFPDLQRADEWLKAEIAASSRRSPGALVTTLFPERLARALASRLPEKLGELTRDSRLELARRLTATPLEITGHRGYSFAETTAGGVELREVDTRTMESKVLPGLYLCGEMLDVDGRIGGFNFQWAWASGYLAGRGAVSALGVSS